MASLGKWHHWLQTQKNYSSGRGSAMRHTPALNYLKGGGGGTVALVFGGSRRLRRSAKRKNPKKGFPLSSSFPSPSQGGREQHPPLALPCPLFSSLVHAPLSPSRRRRRRRLRRDGGRVKEVGVGGGGGGGGGGTLLQKMALYVPLLVLVGHSPNLIGLKSHRSTI